MFISAPCDGHYYFAQRSHRSLKLLWTMVPMIPTAPDRRIEACDVPHSIRRQAYRMFYADRQRGQP